MINNFDSIFTKLAYIYLVLPFLIFSVFWLNLPASIFFSIITILSLFLCFKNTKNDETIGKIIVANKNQIYIGLAIISVFMFFSGIGSYTFQNLDHLYRNAIFRDLVKFDWPVMYHVSGFGKHILEGKTTIMTYYLGYFLPAALFGKIFGFKAAQFALLLWSTFGLILIVFQVGKFLKRFNLKLILLFLGWGTLFYLGAIYKYSLNDILEEKSYLWAGMILYADSNAGLIYWTFNQSLTAWLIIMLVMNNDSKKNILFFYGLCFFLSPFAFVGLLPFMGYYFYKNFNGTFNRVINWRNNIVAYFSFQNVIGSGAILFLNRIYLSSNPASNFFQPLHHNLRIFIYFILFSWGVIAALIFLKYRKDPLYWLIILVLLPLPFFQLGYGIDFPGRISIPALFILMLLVGRFLIEEKRGVLRYAVMVYMAVSALGHTFFESGRSIYYTTLQNISHNTDLDKDLIKSNNPTTHQLGEELLEIKHKDILTKDLGTVINPKNEVIWNYMADIDNNKFYKYFAKKPNQK